MSDHIPSQDITKAYSKALARVLENGDVAQLEKFMKVADERITELQSQAGKRKQSKALRGMGGIYQRGGVWWVRYSHRGRLYRESSRSRKETDATKLLKKRMGEIGQGRLIGPSEEKVTFDEMAQDLCSDYKVNGRKSLDTVQYVLSHLEESFTGDSALDITTDRINGHVAQRQEEKASNATVNRELAALKRMFSLAIQAGKLSHQPYIPTLEEHNARQGFLEHGEFLTLRENLPTHLKDPITFLYFSGWRVSEMRALEWRDVDLNGRVIRLRPEISKNKDGRLLPLSGEILELIERDHRDRSLAVPTVFHHNGKPIGSFRKAWATACKAAALNGIIVHDLRRTAIRNLIRAGVPERVAMALSGHKTRAVFDRYNIVSESDLQRASESLQVHINNQPAKLTVVSMPKAG